jgi:hypothetical protein
MRVEALLSSGEPRCAFGSSDWGGVLPAAGDIADTARSPTSGVFGSSHLLKRSQEASTSLFDTRDAKPSVSEKGGSKVKRTSSR